MKVKEPGESKNWPQEVKCTECKAVLVIETDRDVFHVTDEGASQIRFTCPKCNQENILTTKKIPEILYSRLLQLGKLGKLPRSPEA